MYNIQAMVVVAQPAPVTSRLSLIHDLSKTRQLHHDSWEASQPSLFFIKATLRISDPLAFPCHEFAHPPTSTHHSLQVMPHSVYCSIAQSLCQSRKQWEQNTPEKMKQIQLKVGFDHWWTERTSKPKYIDLDKFACHKTEELESTSHSIHVLVWNTLEDLNF